MSSRYKHCVVLIPEPLGSFYLQTSIMPIGLACLAQSRKRRREEDLTNDCQNSVYDAEEFRNSYLLYGLPQELSSEVKTIRKHTTHVFRKNTEHVHSNNNLQHQQHLSSMNSSSRGKCKDCPCAGLDTMMILIDRNSRRCLKKLMASEGEG